MAVVFGGAAVYAAAAFGVALGEHRVRTGMLFLAFLLGACAAGLWGVRAWGRNLALVTTLANSGVGVLQVLATVLDRGPATAAAAWLGGNLLLFVALTRHWFALPEEAP